MLNIAIRAARAAGGVMVRYVDRLDAVRVTAKAENDFVTEVDREAERRIIDVIHRAYPDHAFVAEESGATGRSEFEWVIDPLDGTTNFLHGFPQFSVSIALRHRGVLDQAVIFDPLRQELFTASRGVGAQLDGRRIRVSPRAGLNGALLGTGFPFRSLHELDMYLDTFRAFVQCTAGVRRAGSAALDLAYVAAGRLDGFWEFGLSPWDVAAGALIVQEAGGIVSDTAGGKRFLDRGDVAAGNPRVLEEMLATLRPLLRPPYAGAA